MGCLSAVGSFDFAIAYIYRDRFACDISLVARKVQMIGPAIDASRSILSNGSFLRVSIFVFYLVLRSLFAFGLWLLTFGSFMGENTDSAPALRVDL